jgi:hypothetical protein
MNGQVVTKVWWAPPALSERSSGPVEMLSVGGLAGSDRGRRPRAKPRAGRLIYAPKAAGEASVIHAHEQPEPQHAGKPLDFM